MPQYTQAISCAESWVTAGSKVYCRTTLTDHSGSGIVIATTPEELVPAPLYTKALDINKEYRIHVFNGKVIDAVQKKRRSGANANPLIRNHSNGWVFARQDINVTDTIKNISIKAVAALGLDFGACDVGVTEDGTPFIFEINTAPGLEGSTVQAYVNAIKEYIHAFNVG